MPPFFKEIIVLSLLILASSCGESTCPFSSKEVDGKCQENADDADAGADGGTHQPDVACKESFTRVGDKCVGPDTPPCEEGFTRVDEVCVTLDPCVEHSAAAPPCVLHATCTVTEGAARCACDEGFEGDGSTCTRNPCVPFHGEAAPCGAAQQLCFAKSEAEIECSCAEGFKDCDGDLANGCEVELTGDAKNCGACGFACAEGLGCTEGSCEQRLVSLAVNRSIYPEYCGISPSGESRCIAFLRPSTFDAVPLPPQETTLVGTSYGFCSRSGDTISCKGDNSLHTLGSSDTKDTSSTLRFDSLQDLSGGGAHACVVARGQVYCWGAGHQGQLGDGQTYTLETRSRPYSANRPVLLSLSGQPALSGAIQVAAGYGHTCALLRTGVVQCWGTMIQGSPAHFAEPIYGTNSIALRYVTSVCSGQNYSCALREDGSVACWGVDPAWMIENVDVTPSRNASRSISLPEVDSITCGGAHVCARTRNGEAYCWGANQNGQLGIGNSRNSSSPARVLTLTDVAEIQAGYTTTCARQRNGGIYCWGAIANPNVLTPKEITNWP